MHELLNPTTRPEAYRQVQNEINNIGNSFENTWQQLTSPDVMTDMRFAGGLAPDFIFGGDFAAARFAFAVDAMKDLDVFEMGMGGKRIINPLNFQVAHEMTMSKNEFKRLVDSIKINGIQEPIKYVEHQGKNYIVDGNHRMMAARHLGITSIPAQQVDLPFSGYKKHEDLYYYGGKF